MTDITQAHLTPERLAEIRERDERGTYDFAISDRSDLLAHIATLTRERDERLWECPDCGFQCAAEHITDDDPEPCALCAEQRLTRELAAARAVTDEKVERVAAMLYETDHANLAQEWCRETDRETDADVIALYRTLARRALTAALGEGE